MGYRGREGRHEALFIGSIRNLVTDLELLGLVELAA
jgi:hypothetical protein